MGEEKVPKRAGVWEDLGTSLVDLQPAPRQRPSVRLRGDRGSLTSFRRRRSRLIVSSTVALVLLLALISVQAISSFSSLRLPAALRSPYLLTLLGALVFLFVVRTYFEAVRSLGFISRFIRPGLRRLVDQRGEDLARGRKLFRGRKTAIMKIDIADFTRTTFDMPYGMRRLFVDLWFTLIDQVVAGRVFLDKSLGDGSVYYFDDRLEEGCCAAALSAALEIRSRQVQLYDQTFKRLLCVRLADSDELAQAVAGYFTRYRERTASSFWDRCTEIRIALVAGYVDEGLWGLSAQSHYDAQGTLPILVTRLEEQARNGEIVLDRAFLAELGSAGAKLLKGTKLDRRSFDLKGIGTWEVFVLARHQE